jgi:hypothetical protein
MRRPWPTWGCRAKNRQTVCLLVNFINFVAYEVLRSGYNPMHLLLKLQNSEELFKDKHNIYEICYNSEGSLSLEVLKSDLSVNIF